MTGGGFVAGALFAAPVVIGCLVAIGVCVAVRAFYRWCLSVIRDEA